ncbi:ATP-binding cassette domain-containing protein, partial [Pandoraea sp. PE-S2R-1]|uniref:ATP-binding cassette domain-containing protein n=1 Tax=Pandoraea sp. PE-S2R-1 TaxID=1986994 RepID=UPI001130273B
MSENLVARVQNLSVAFGSSKANLPPVVRNVSFDVRRGQTLAIVGESGSGKSVTSLSMMRLIELGGGRIVSGSMQLHTPSGEVIDLAQTPEEKMRRLRGSAIGMIFQEPMTSLNPVFKIGAQLIEAIRLHQPGSRSATQAQ